MSNLFKSRYRTYLIDHHSPSFPCITFDKLNFSEYEEFYKTAKIDSLMVYCKDHWGMSYYPSQLPDTVMHPALHGIDYVGNVRDICRRNDIEFVAYFSFEYDSGIALKHPEWRVVDAEGKPIIRNDKYAKWSLNCMQTGYRDLCIKQIEEIITKYHPDALFLDIFGCSLCYCNTCKTLFFNRYGYNMPETKDAIQKSKRDIHDFLTHLSIDLLTSIKQHVKAIDPDVPVTINFASHYPEEVRCLLDYQFAEPVVQDNWFSARFTRDTSIGRYPILMAGEFSSVYNYHTKERYIADLSAIVAHGCRVGLYSGVQHTDGTLEKKEAELIGSALVEVEKIHDLTFDAKPVRYIGILQNDLCDSLEDRDILSDSILRLKHSSPHINAILGAMKLCEHQGVPYKIIPESETDDLCDFKVLLLPEYYIVSSQLCDRLSDFVRKGGSLIIAGKSGLYSNSFSMQSGNTLEDLIGAKHVCIHDEFSSNTWSAYVSTAGKADPVIPCDTTPPVSEYFVETKLTQGHALASFVKPCIRCDSDHWINWWSPPPGELTNMPAVIENIIDKGKVYYCAFDLFSMASEENYEICHTLFSSLLSNSLHSPMHVTSSAPDVVRNVFSRTDDGIVYLHQLSQLPFRFNGQVVPVRGGNLIISSKKRPSVKQVYPITRELDVTLADSEWQVELPEMEIQQVISIAY